MMEQTLQDRETPLAGTIGQLATPALLIDKRVLETNIARGRARADAFGFRLRLHVKTVKSAELAGLVFTGASRPLTVSTLAEAEYMSAMPGWNTA